MPIYQIQKYKPQIGQGCFIAPTAVVIGRVMMGNNVSTWFQSVIRADVASISIGDNTNIQDLSLLHVSDGIDLKIGKNVTIGHKVTLHSCTIEDNCLIGMDSTILDKAVISSGSVVAAGSVVPPGKVYPPNSLIMGSPAKVQRPLSEEECAIYHNHFESYLIAKNTYVNELKEF